MAATLFPAGKLLAKTVRGLLYWLMSNLDPECASISLLNMTDLVDRREDANMSEWREYLGEGEDEQWEGGYPL